MTNEGNGLDLTVSLPAAEVAAMRRRITFLEAILVQVLRGQRSMKEWFSSAELVELRLPGLPLGKGAITRQAREQRWPTRSISGRNEYHFSGLPRRAFEALIDRVLAPAAMEADDSQVVPAIAPAPPIPESPPKELTPPWLLPLMRMIRTEAPATLDDTMNLLPSYLPPGMRCPSLADVLPELRRLGMVK